MISPSDSQAVSGTPLRITTPHSGPRLRVFMRVVFYGSSTVAGAGLEDITSRFSTVACRALGWTEVNLGIAGTLVTGRDLDAQIISQESGVVRVPDIFDVNPDLVIVLYGLDDCVAGTIAGDPFDHRPGTFASDYDSIVRGIMGGLGGDKLVLMPLEFAAVGGAKPGPDAYNAAISAIAKRYSIRLIDLQDTVDRPASATQAPAEPPYALNAEGHAWLADVLIREFAPQSAA